MNTAIPDLSEILPLLLTAVPSVLLIIIGAVVLNIAVGRGLLFLGRRTRFTEEEILPVRKTFKWLITVAAVVMILGSFGLNVGGMWGVLSTVLAMVAIGFVAVWSVLSNTLCTVIIMVFRPFSVGDEVEFAGEPVKGRVIDLNFIYTTLDAGDGAVMQVPNNMFFQKALKRRRTAASVSPAAHLRTKRPDTPEGTVSAAPDTHSPALEPQKQTG